MDIFAWDKIQNIINSKVNLEDFDKINEEINKKIDVETINNLMKLINNKIDRKSMDEFINDLMAKEHDLFDTKCFLKVRYIIEPIFIFAFNFSKSIFFS